MSQYKTQEEVALLINTADEKSVCLIHYLTALDQHQSIEQLVKCGADVNIKVGGTNIGALVIAAAHGYETTSAKLTELGAQLHSAVLIQPSA
eukprot:CAMPEP_0185597286 /NCGR_PEP_ID=MMETSP0434-20130131/81273_1 /TAXON_ID=626734 ORGANISM="Favella taraikaensis, Strain Fe Narragansett Bay" /NCGR_SAMPLE_ID=MMETSP0434 /ASSEMBLY_ACC=CAM_ASM_000379 /LENGTH=91 /DNA_ID=CAMNT_0028225973 /DNA_START=849 /DNA_END=1124 /DNA_ORIENTATION=-